MARRVQVALLAAGRTGDGSQLAALPLSPRVWPPPGPLPVLELLAGGPLLQVTQVPAPQTLGAPAQLTWSVTGSCTAVTCPGKAAVCELGGEGLKCKRSTAAIPGLAALRLLAEGSVPRTRCCRPRHSSVHTGSLLREKRCEHNRPIVEVTRGSYTSAQMCGQADEPRSSRAVRASPGPPWSHARFGEKLLKPASSLLCLTRQQED